MRLLLIEDDIAHCKLYRQQIVLGGHIHILNIAHGVKDALGYVRREVPDVILLDLELRGSDGSGLLFLQMLQIDKESAPYIIVITNNSSPKTFALARQYGTDFIIPKYKPDYSPQYVIDFAYQYYLLSQSERVSIDSLSPPVEEKIEQYLENIGITYDMSGRKYIAEAARLVLERGIFDVQLGRDIYPIIARRYGKSDASIDRAIGNAIKKAWRISSMETLARYYTPKTSLYKGVPTNKEFIFYVADKLSQESKA